MKTTAPKAAIPASQQQPEPAGGFLRRVAQCAILLSALLAASVRAGNHTWTGAAGGGLWSTAGNWQSSSKPVAGEANLRIIFPASGTATSTADIANLVVHEFQIARGTNNTHTLNGTAGMKVVLQAQAGFTNINVLSGTFAVLPAVEFVLTNDCRSYQDGYVHKSVINGIFQWGEVALGGLVLSNRLSGPGGLYLDGFGKVLMAGTAGNTHTGLTRVAPHLTLQLNKAAGNAVPGPLQIDFDYDVGGPNPQVDPSLLYRGEVDLLDDHQLSDTGAITNSGYIQAHNRTETLGSLTLTHGVIDGAGGAFTLNGPVNVSWEDLPPDLDDLQSSQITCDTLDLGAAVGSRSVREFNTDTNALLTLDANITGAATMELRKNGEGWLVLNGTNTFSGNLTVNGGELGANPLHGLGTTNGHCWVNSGAKLTLNDGTFPGQTNVMSEYFHLNGGTLEISTWGTIIMPSQIYVLADSTIVGSTMEITGPVSGTGGLCFQHSHAGILGGAGIRFTGNQTNTYTGLTMLDNAEIDLARAPGATVIPGSLIMQGPDSYGVVNVLSTNQISSNALVRANYRGILNLASNITQTVAGLELAGGSVEGPGTLALSGDIAAMTNIYWNGSRIESRLHLKSGASHAIAVQEVLTAFPDLEISGPLTSDASIGFTKTGAGVLTLSGTNTFSGGVVVNGGTVLAKSSQAFGAGGGIGVYVYPDATVHLADNVSVANEPLTLAGGGLTAGAGAHRWGGTVAVSANSWLEVSNSLAVLEFPGVMSGAASLHKGGSGTLLLDGSAANTFSGAFFIDAGEVALSKTNVIALAGNVAIGTATNAATLRLHGANQIASSSSVHASYPASLFDLQGYTQTLAAFTGGAGINIGSGLLSVAGGWASGVITGNGAFMKLGGSAFSLTGNSPAFTGETRLYAGTLIVDGSLANSPVVTSAGTTLAGNGSVGPVNNSGAVSPGTSPGKLTTKNFTNNATATLALELNGTVAGVSYDQLDVTGTVKLGGALQLSRGAGTPANSTFTIIKNDGADAVNGTFAGLAQGAQVTAGGAKFQISYTGGDGNDVVLTQVATATNALMTSVARQAGGAMLVQGVGSPGFDYAVQASTNLSTTNWVNLGPVTPAGSGALIFNDAASTNLPSRFYRFVIP